MSEIAFPTNTYHGLQISGSVRLTQLNNGPGEIMFTGTLTPDRAHQTLRFTSGSPASNGRAWQFESSPSVRGVTPAGNLAFDRVLFGFIQTVEYYACVARYANDARVYLAAEQARDSMTTSVPAPWFDREGTSSGPVTPGRFATLAHPIQIEDAPQVVFHAFRDGSPLHTVALEGVFGIRFIARSPTADLSVSSIAILAHARIRVALLFENNQTDLPTLPLSWTKRGNVAVIGQGAGRGPGPIVTQNPLAKQQLASPAATDTRRQFLQPRAP